MTKLPMSWTSKVIEDFYPLFAFAISISTVYFLYSYASVIPSFFTGIFVGSAFGAIGVCVFLGRFAIDYLSSMSNDVASLFQSHSDEILRILREKGIVGQVFTALLPVFLPRAAPAKAPEPPLTTPAEVFIKPNNQTPLPRKEESFISKPITHEKEIKWAIIYDNVNYLKLLLDTYDSDSSKLDVLCHEIVDLTKYSDTVIYLSRIGLVNGEKLLKRYATTGNLRMVHSLTDACAKNNKEQ